jgi:hypothetical protein
MVRIAISREAYDAIYATLLLGSVAVELEANERGERLTGWRRPGSTGSAPCAGRTRAIAT